MFRGSDKLPKEQIQDEPPKRINSYSEIIMLMEQKQTELQKENQSLRQQLYDNNIIPNHW